MVHKDDADDYVVATSEFHSVREFAQLAFSLVGRDYKNHVVVDTKFYRPAELVRLVGNPVKAGQGLGWRSSTPFRALVRLMLEADLRAADVSSALL